jgi:hypothetical protein
MTYDANFLLTSFVVDTRHGQVVVNLEGPKDVEIAYRAYDVEEGLSEVQVVALGELIADIRRAAVAMGTGRAVSFPPNLRLTSLYPETPPF